MSSITPAHRSLLRDRLAGIEFRNQLRQARRRSILQASLERQREGTARHYETISTRLPRFNPLTASIQKQGREK